MERTYWCHICKRNKRFVQHTDFKKKWICTWCGFTTSNPQAEPEIARRNAYQEAYEKAVKRSNTIINPRSK